VGGVLVAVEADAVLEKGYWGRRGGVGRPSVLANGGALSVCSRESAASKPQPPMPPTPKASRWISSRPPWPRACIHCASWSTWGVAAAGQARRGSEGGGRLEPRKRQRAACGAGLLAGGRQWQLLGSAGRGRRRPPSARGRGAPQAPGCGRRAYARRRPSPRRLRGGGARGAPRWGCGRGGRAGTCLQAPPSPIPSARRATPRPRRPPPPSSMCRRRTGPSSSRIARWPLSHAHSSLRGGARGGRGGPRSFSTLLRGRAPADPRPGARSGVRCMPAGASSFTRAHLQRSSSAPGTPAAIACSAAVSAPSKWPMDLWWR
jgi:hypothetical protein